MVGYGGEKCIVGVRHWKLAASETVVVVHSDCDGLQVFSLFWSSLCSFAGGFRSLQREAKSQTFRLIVA
ncbi:MAG: hypothetical protein ACKERG_02515 [Candidatus Hodgkinia cicadicola]